jgi:hypothetical protein
MAKIGYASDAGAEIFPVGVALLQTSPRDLQPFDIMPDAVTRRTTKILVVEHLDVDGECVGYMNRRLAFIRIIASTLHFLFQFA